MTIFSDSSFAVDINIDFDYELDKFRRHYLLEGLDEIALTLEHADEIRQYEARKKDITPWLFQD